MSSWIRFNSGHQYWCISPSYYGNFTLNDEVREASRFRFETNMAFEVMNVDIPWYDSMRVYLAHRNSTNWVQVYYSSRTFLTNSNQITRRTDQSETLTNFPFYPNDDINEPLEDYGTSIRIRIKLYRDNSLVWDSLGNVDDDYLYVDSLVPAVQISTSGSIPAAQQLGNTLSLEGLTIQLVSHYLIRSFWNETKTLTEDDFYLPTLAAVGKNISYTLDYDYNDQSTGLSLTVTTSVKNLVLSKSSITIDSSSHLVDEQGVSALDVLRWSAITAKLYENKPTLHTPPNLLYTSLSNSQLTTSGSITLKNLYDSEGIVNLDVSPTDYPTLKQNLRVQLSYLQVTSITLSSVVFNSTYYYSVDNEFDGLDATVTVNFNDGTSDIMLLSNTTHSLYKNSSCTIPLNEDDILNSNNITEIYVKIPYDVDQDVTVEKVVQVSIPYIANTLQSVTLTSAVTFVLGNKLNEQKSLFAGKLLGTYLNGSTAQISENNVTFDETDFILEDPEEELTITCAGATFTLIDSDTKITYTAPSGATLTFANAPVASYKDVVDTIDITGVIVTLSFSNATYTKDYDYYDFVSAKLYDSDSQEVSVALDGSANINLGLTDIGTYNLIIKVADDVCLVDRTITQEFTIFPNFEIIGLKIEQTYEDYKVGDQFLVKEDSIPSEQRTKIRIYFEHGGNSMSKVIELKDNLAGLSITPPRGHKFKNPTTNQVVRVVSVVDSSVYTEYSMVVSPAYISDSSTEKQLVGIWTSGFFHSGEDGDEYVEAEKGVIALIPERVNGQETTSVVNGIRTLNADFDLDDEGFVLGYITNILNEYEPAKLVMFNDYVPPIDGSANIVVEYPSYNEGSADNINKCHFGILFGTNNATNRLFLSGNPDIPNADWHSAEINTTNLEGDTLKTNGDFSYFADVSIMYYGETDNDIVGYDIVSNDKLFVVKTKSDKEKTVYFRTPITVKALDASGSEMRDIAGNYLYQEEFALVKGNNSVAGISPKSIINFNGDTLFVDSDNHLLGLDLEGIVGDSQRYATSRSRFIDERLRHLDLSNAILWTNNKYLFLSIPNYGLFVTHFETRSDGQYEWWFLTSESPTAFIEIDNVIYFFNDKGETYTFTESYVDVLKKFISEGDTLLEIVDNSNEISYNSALGLEANVDYKLLIKPSTDYRKEIYYQVATIGRTTGYDLKIVNDTLVSKSKIFGDDMVFKLGRIEGITPNIDQTGNVFSLSKKYQLKEVEDSSNHVYQLYELGSSTPLSLTTLNTAGLCRSIADKEVDVVDVDTENYTFKLALDGEYLNLVIFGLQDPVVDIVGEFKTYKNVEAYYITAPFVMGSINNFKTVWGFTVTNDTNYPSEVDIAYASNKIPNADTKVLGSLSKAALGLDFNEMNYTTVDFDKTIVPRTYTQYRTLGMQKFMCFAFKNYNDTNAVLSAMSIVYTIPFPSYGSN